MKPQMKKSALILAVVIAAFVAAILHPSKTGAAGASYQLVEHWGQIPNGAKWGVMSAVAVDGQDNVYLFQRSDPVAKIMVFDSSGKFLREFGEGSFVYPHGIHVQRDGSVWATDRQMQQALEFNPMGKLLMSVGEKNGKGDESSMDKFNGVSDIVMAQNGDLFASDGEGGNSRVVKIGKDGKFIKYWGSKGSDPGQFNVPHAIAMDSKGNVWVADRGNKRLQVFDQDGKFLKQLTEFGAPAGVAIGKDDTVYVAVGAPENYFTVGTPEGKILAKVEGLDNAHGIAVDSTGAVYISESFSKNVLKYAKK